MSEYDIQMCGIHDRCKADRQRIAELEAYIEKQTRDWLAQHKRIAELEQELAEADELISAQKRDIIILQALRDTEPEDPEDDFTRGKHDL